MNMKYFKNDQLFSNGLRAVVFGMCALAIFVAAQPAYAQEYSTDGGDSSYYTDPGVSSSYVTDTGSSYFTNAPSYYTDTGASYFTNAPSYYTDTGPSYYTDAGTNPSYYTDTGTSYFTDTGIGYPTSGITSEPWYGNGVVNTGTDYGYTNGGHSTSGGIASTPYYGNATPTTGSYNYTSTNTSTGGGISSSAYYGNAVPNAIVAYNYGPTGFSSGGVSSNYGYGSYASPSYVSSPNCTLTTSQNYVNYGQSATLYWSNIYGAAGTITGLGGVPSTGSSVVTPAQSTTYTATFAGPGGNDTCYASVAVAGGPAVSVSLKDAPYTGLDLGPVGTALYWLALVLFCAGMAYLFAVKKVQQKPLAWLRVFFFGDATQPSHPVYAPVHVSAQGHSAHASAANHDQSHAAPAVPAFLATNAIGHSVPSSDDAIDEFIWAQINRTR